MAKANPFFQLDDLNARRGAAEARRDRATMALRAARDRAQMLTNDLRAAEQASAKPDRLSALLAGKSTSPDTSTLEKRAAEEARLRHLSREAEADVEVLGEELHCAELELVTLSREIGTAEFVCISALEDELLARYQEALGHFLSQAIQPLAVVVRERDLVAKRTGNTAVDERDARMILAHTRLYDRLNKALSRNVEPLGQLTITPVWLAGRIRTEVVSEQLAAQVAQPDDVTIAELVDQLRNTDGL